MIKRTLLKELIEHTQKKEISLIVGPRQAGKTTIMEMLNEYLIHEGKHTLFLNLDRESDKRYFASQKELINKINLELGHTKEAYVFIDEIQRKENAGLFLKGLYDTHTGCKFIVSGSGSLELKEKIHESLTGRKRIFELNTLSFEEFVHYKTSYRYETALPEFFKVEQERTQELLAEYLHFGGYPRIVLEETIREKQRIIDEIYHSVLEKDMSYLLKIEKIEAFSMLIRLLAGQNGKIINYSELSSTVGISLKTLKDYCWYAEKTFLIRRITPYYTNIRKEITKAPVMYFTDAGLRNHALGIFGRTLLLSEMSFLFQNFILEDIRRCITYSGTTVHFWRTTDKAEVDFVVYDGSKVIPIEAKCAKLKNKKPARAVQNFIAKYNPLYAYIVHLGAYGETMVGSTNVVYVPFYRFKQELSDVLMK